MPRRSTPRHFPSRSRHDFSSACGVGFAGGAGHGLAGRQVPLAGWLLTTIVAGIAPVAAAWLMRLVLDALATGARQREPVGLILALALASGAQAVLPYLSQYLGAQSGRTVQRRASTELMTAVAGLAGLRRLEDPGYRDRLSLAEQVGQAGPGQVVMSLANIVQGAVTAVQPCRRH